MVKWPDGARPCALGVLGDVDIRELVPVREPVPHAGQQHISGLYWSAVTQGHVWHESMEERAFLVALDCDPEVTHVLAQPFKLSWRVGGKLREFTPDYLVERDGGMLSAVSVKQRAGRYHEFDRFLAAQEILADVGIGLLLWSAGDSGLPTNLEFLAAFRRPWSALAAVVERRYADLAPPFTLRWLYRQGDPELVLTAWTAVLRRDLRCDLDRPFDDNTTLEATK